MSEALLPPKDIVQKLDEVQKWLDCHKGVIYMEDGEGWYIAEGLQVKIFATVNHSEKLIENEIGKNKSGYVYLLHCPQNDLYKIGRATHSPTRQHQIAKQSPVEINMLHSFLSDNAPLAEKILHEKNAAKRVRGEWFCLTYNEVREITSLQDGSL